MASSTTTAATTHLDDTRAIDGALIAELFPSKSDEKRSKWVSELNNQEFDTVGQLRVATEEAWKALLLPIAIKDSLRRAISVTPATPSAAAAAAAAPAPAPVARSDSSGSPASPRSASSSYSSSSDNSVEKETSTHPITQIDVILFDVSGSMRSRSFDREKSRAEAGKILFSGMIDHMCGAELQHALALLTFGERITERPFNRDLSRFETALGELSTDEGCTLLWDAIKRAAEIIIHYRKAKADKLALSCPCRIFCLTDGEDTSSRNTHWKVAQFLRENDIILDAFPLADPNKYLQAMAAVTGGLCLKVATTAQGVQLFEREAVLQLSTRESVDLPPIPVDESGLTSLFKSERSEAREDVHSAVSKSVTAPTLMGVYEICLASKKADTTRAQRIFKELRTLMDNPIPGVLGAFPNADDVYYWKILIAGPPKTPYEGGNWCLLVQFPVNYPDSAPKVKFAPQTPCYHLSVSGDGKVCMDVLSSQSWNSSMSISRVLISLFDMLEQPNSDNSLDTYKASLYRDNKEQYLDEARKFTSLNASKSVEQLRKLFGIDV